MIGALLLTPGAGSDRRHSTLVRIEEAMAPVPTARIDFPYRRAGRKAPDAAPKLIACIREESAALVTRAGVDPAALVLGGRSMGGRMCSLAVAEGLPAAGLVLLSYPLHPPGRPERLRVDHFGALDLPCLFVSGTKDPFGSPEELEAHTAAIPGPVTHVWIDGAGHEVKDRKSENQNREGLVVDAVVSWLHSIEDEGSPDPRVLAVNDGGVEVRGPGVVGGPRVVDAGKVPVVTGGALPSFGLLTLQAASATSNTATAMNTVTRRRGTIPKVYVGRVVRRATRGAALAE